MHNVEVFVNYDPPCNSVSTARRLNKRSKKKKKEKKKLAVGLELTFLSVMRFKSLRMSSDKTSPQRRLMSTNCVIGMGKLCPYLFILFVNWSGAF